MNTRSHKGYTARVEYDERDNIFVGRILGIRNIISFHGETVAELRAEFEHAVKDYLADCKKDGVTPEIHGRALVAAQAAGKSLNQWATEVLQHAVQSDGWRQSALQNEPRHPRRRVADVKRQLAVAQLHVAGRHPVKAAQMLGPRLVDDLLHIAAGFVQVVQQLP